MAIVGGVEAGLAARTRGATMLQLRAPGLTTRSLEAAASRLVAESGLPVVVSRRVDVALAAGAAGVNLPEDDLPVSAARKLLGAGAFVGRSVHDLAGAVAAANAGASHLVFGPVFSTPTHPGRPGAGMGALAAVCAAVTIPVIAIGGLDRETADACLEVGAAGHAAIRMYR